MVEGDTALGQRTERDDRLINRRGTQPGRSLRGDPYRRGHVHHTISSPAGPWRNAGLSGVLGSITRSRLLISGFKPRTRTG
jgi:hypothetical protein